MSQAGRWIAEFPGNFVWSNAALVTKGMAPYGAVALGEIDEVCERLRDRQKEPEAWRAWSEEWCAMGCQLEQVADAAAAGACEAGHETGADGIVGDDEHDGRRPHNSLRELDRRRRQQDDVRLARHDLGREGGHAVVFTVGRAKIEHEVLPLDPAVLPEPVTERLDVHGGRHAGDEADAHGPGLRERCERREHEGEHERHGGQARHRGRV